MPEPRDAEQSVLMDLEPGSEGSVRPKSAVDKTFRRYDQDQPMLLAPDLRDWLPADDAARWVDDLVEHGLDLAPFYDDYTEARGTSTTTSAPTPGAKPKDRHPPPRTTTSPAPTPTATPTTNRKPTG